MTPAPVVHLTTKALKYSAILSELQTAVSLMTEDKTGFVGS